MNVDMRHGRPAVCIKVHRHVSLRDLEPAKLRDWDATDPDFPAWLNSWLDAYEDTGAMEGTWQLACEDAIATMIEDAENVFTHDACALGMPRTKVEVVQDGRSGGWLYVKGLPDPVEHWDGVTREAWKRWADACAGECASVEYRMASGLYHAEFTEWAEDRDRRNEIAEQAETLINRTSR